ncbi:mRNA decay activator protein ZFP36L1-like [Clupea harengus]|uniref:mRNA decay activator protein ZFP36 n=1 Tax=Clupea harengus TaxID=7950 RepID=A0A6P3VGP3_CLUHA|nr:mRNA decay activator protein ZFP36L1-like [Clupea harengus]
MADAIVSAFFDYDEVVSKNTKMLNFNNTFSGPPSSTGVTPLSPPPTGPLLDRRAVGSPPSSSAGGLHQRRHSANSLSLPPPPGARDPRLRERCYSETGDRLRAPGGGGGILAAITSSGIGQVNSSRYKTELCRPFEEHGACKYGEKCQFAHGHQELRSLSRHPKYKTELCRTFHSIGFCPYGPRCHFIHNAEERCGPMPPNDGHGRASQPPHPARPRLHHSLSFAGFPSALSLSPPPCLAADWPSSDPFSLPSQELAQLFGSGLADPPVLRPPTVPCPPDSLSDQEGYQSSLGSQSGSESPTMDAARRLPIFSWLSISDD